MLKRRRPQPGDKWYMDEVFIRIRGKQHYLWRAVDQQGNVLDILVQSRRSATAAKRFFRKLLKGLRYVPRVIVTDKLKSYAAAKRKILFERRAPSKPISQQSRRDLASTDTTTRATDATLQVSASCPALSFHSQPDPQPLSASPPSPQCQPISCGSRCCLSHMA